MSHFCFWECALEYNATSQAQVGADWTLVETMIRGMEYIRNIFQNLLLGYHV